MIRKTLISILGILMLTACGRDDGEPGAVETRAVDADAINLFERIDADSVYVAANLQTLPEELVDMLWQPMSGLSEANRDTYEQMAESIEADSPLGAAMLRELGMIDSREALEARGLASNGSWAMHAMSFYPVMHWQLSDAAAFEALLERLAVESGTPLPRRGIDEAELIWLDLGNVGLAIHHDEQFLTVGLVPDDHNLLRRLANLDQPAEAMEPRRLESFNRDRGYSPYGSGYLDLTALLDRLLDADDEQAASGRQLAGLEELATDPSCRSELQALVNIFPRVSFGLPQVDTRQLTATMRMETEPGFGSRLARLVDTPVGLDLDGTDLITIGMALNLVAARDFGREVVGGWVDNPPQCALFEGIRSGAEEWQLALNRPIPPIVTNIQGFRLDLSRVGVNDLAAISEDPSSAYPDSSGTLTVFMRNPQMLIGMAQMFSPELAGLELRPGGEPKRLPAGMVPDLDNLETWIGLGSGSIGLAAGTDGKERLTEALRATDGDDSTLIGYSINVAAYGELMQRLAESETEDAFQLQGLDFLGGFGELYEETRISVHLSENGIDFNSSSTLKR